LGSRPLKRILLVEDDPDIQMVTSMTLGSFGGYTVQACSSALQAIECAAAFAPDLILLDMMMPGGKDGMYTLKALREIPQTASTPVILLTAKVQPSDVVRYKDLDSLALIRKPFEPTALVDTIQGIWTRYSAQAH
jgi:two-component system OmpR family response regulator